MRVPSANTPTRSPEEKPVGEHGHAPGALRDGVGALEVLVGLVPGELELDREAEQVPVEGHRARQVGSREGRVVDADDHGDERLRVVQRRGLAVSADRDPQ